MHSQCDLGTTYAHSPVFWVACGGSDHPLGVRCMVNRAITFGMGSLAGVTVSPVLPERGRDDLPPPSGSWRERSGRKSSLQTAALSCETWSGRTVLFDSLVDLIS